MTARPRVEGPYFGAETIIQLTGALSLEGAAKTVSTDTGRSVAEVKEKNEQLKKIYQHYH